MSSAGRFKFVNVVPTPKAEPTIKIEMSDEETELISCPMCTKEFASALALRNHGRTEHTNTFIEKPNLFECSDMADSTNKRPAPAPIKPIKLKFPGQRVLLSKSPSPGSTMVKVVKPVIKLPKKQPIVVSSYEEMDAMIKKREQALLSSMKPSSLQELASTDVEYIIVKAEKEDIVKPKKPKVVKVENVSPTSSKVVKGTKDVTPKDVKVPDPITGPFECLQPSTLVADGLCHQIFFSCCDYSLHFREEHTRYRKALRCQICEKPLMRSETDAPFSCLTCGAGFDTNEELMDHNAVEHVKLKPFECSVCHKRFTQQGGVQQHMRMHTGVRPFHCTYCSKSFTQKSGLDQHQRIHTGVKPYRCVICSKTFIQSVHLKQHVRTHTNVSPFQCGICNKRFKQSSHLNYHLKNHNPESMTPEQRKKFEGLIKEVNESEEKKLASRKGREVVRRMPKNVVLVTQENGKLIAIDEDQFTEYSVITEGEVSMDQEMEETGSVEDQDQVQDSTEELQQSEEDHQEQLLAEQSIAVEVDTETYILGDVGDTWRGDGGDGGDEGQDEDGEEEQEE